MPSALAAGTFGQTSLNPKKSNKIRLLKNHTLVDPKTATPWLAQVEKSKKSKEVPWVDVGDEDEEEHRKRRILAKRQRALQEGAKQKKTIQNMQMNGMAGNKGKGQSTRTAETPQSSSSGVNGVNGSTSSSANHEVDSHQPGDDIPEHDDGHVEPQSPFDIHSSGDPMATASTPVSSSQQNSPLKEQKLNGKDVKKRERDEDEEEKEEKEVADAISLAMESPRKHKRKKRRHSLVNGVANGAEVGSSPPATSQSSTAADTSDSRTEAKTANTGSLTATNGAPKSPKKHKHGVDKNSARVKQEKDLSQPPLHSPQKSPQTVKPSDSEETLKGSIPDVEASSSKLPDVHPASKKASEALQEQRRQLPIAKGRDALIEELRKNDVTVLLGETGSGKTTQIPQYILESGLAGSGKIAVTQPRRVAATSLASRVALESGGRPIGSLVGYSVRFDEKSCPATKIKYMTDGMIVRELLSDPILSAYSVVVVDEAHERTLRTDLLIANLKRIQRARNGANEGGKGKEKEKAKGVNPLKIVIMSATLDAEKFCRFFSGAKIIYVKGRQHPVKIHYSREGQTDYLDSAMRVFFQIHLDQPPGDVLVFLPGQEDIESLEKSIQLFAKQLPKDEKDVLVCPMYAAQAPGQNAKVFHPAPSNTRKCILATNIAETSITIPGVKYVIDTGMCKEKRYLANNTGGGFDTLMTKPITKSSATQRSGRAGREGPGMCFRLYTEDAFRKMPVAPEPEIMRVSLTSSMLQLKCLGQNLEDLDLMDMPDMESVSSALKTLWLLDAIDRNRELTPLGRQMAAFPLEPIYARAILAAKDNGCIHEVIDIISVLSASSKLFVDITEQRETAAEARKKFRSPSGDHLTVLNALRAYADISSNNSPKAVRRDWCRKHFLNERAILEAFDIRDQLQQVCTRLKIDWKVSCGDKDEPVLRSLAFGLVQNSAFLQPDGSYKQVMGHSTVKIHPSSALCEKKVPAIVYDELIFTNQIYARGVSSVPKSVFTTIGALNRRAA